MSHPPRKPSKSPIGTSLKRRLILAAVLWIGAGVAMAGFAVSAIFRSHIDARFRDDLSAHLEELTEDTKFDAQGRPSVVKPLSNPYYELKNSGYYWEISKAQEVLARSPSLLGNALVFPDDDMQDGSVHFHLIAGPTGDLFIAEKTFRRSDGLLRFFVGIDKRHIDDVIRAFDRTLLWALGLFASSLAGAAALLIAYAMRPLQQLRADLTHIRNGKTARLEGSYPDEVLPLVDDLNGMIAATTQSVQKERVRASNLAHGLKTPLAILTDEAYAIARAGLPAAAATIRDQCRRMTVHIDYQLAHARAAATKTTHGTVADAGRVAEAVTSALSRLYKDRGLVIENRLGKACQVACDTQDFNELLANLVDNACKHARAKVVIGGRLDAARRCLDVEVEDDGPGLPEEALEVVFNIGERWDSAAHGSGVGLTIVRELAQLYGGSIRLARSPLGGLKATLSLPAAAADLEASSLEAS